MQRGIMQIDLNILRDIFGLPKDVIIRHVSHEGDDYFMDRIKVYVQGPGLPEVPEGGRAPIVEAEFMDGKFTRFISYP